MNQSITLPSDPLFEELVIASLLIDPTAIAATADMLSASDFYVHQNGAAFRAIVALDASGRDVDLETVRVTMAADGVEVSTDWLARVLESVPTALNVRTYAERVAQLAYRRRAIEAMSQAVAFAYNEKANQSQVEAAVEGAMRAARNGTYTARAASALESANLVTGAAEDWAAHPLKPGQVRGISTGLADLDTLLYGLGVGLHLVAAQPSVGKTAFCLQVAANVATAGGRVVYFSSESGHEDIAMRLISGKCGIYLKDILNGLDHEDYLRFLAAATWFSELRWETIEGALSARQIGRELRIRGDVTLAVVDNLEVTTSASGGNDKDYVKLRSTAYALMDVANENRLPLILTMQAGIKQTDSRPDRRPTLADLYGSDGPAQAAHVVLLLHRPDRWQFDPSKLKNEIEAQCWKDKIHHTGLGRMCVFQFWKQGQVRDKDR